MLRSPLRPVLRDPAYASLAGKWGAPIHEGVMAGATPGIIGSGGSLPTGMQVNGGDTTATVEILTGAQVIDNIECIDFKVSGDTNPSRSVFFFYFPFGFGGVDGAAIGQVWRARFYLQRIALEGSGHWGCSRQVGEVTSGGGYIKDHSDTTAPPDSGDFSDALVTMVPTLDGVGVAKTHGALYLQINNAAAYASCTYRFSAKLAKVSG